MNVLETLFPFFPREYGKYRKTVYSMDHLAKLIDRDNGLDDVYVSVYDKALNIDKVVWDIDSDSPSKLSLALEEAKRLYEKITSSGIPCVPVFSGKKGFHIYALFQPLQLDVFTASELIKNVQEQFIIRTKTTLADNHLIGNTSALIRVPNTLNESRFCVPLPEDFLDWTVDKVLDYALKPRNLIFKFNYRPNIKDFYDPEIFYPTGKPITLEPVDSVPSNPKSLKYLIRPCIFVTITNVREPPHFARAELVTELNALGYSIDDIVEIIKNLNFADFDEKITRKYVEKYVKYIPYSCRRLKSMGVNCMPDCRWRYFWKKEKLTKGELVEPRI